MTRRCKYRCVNCTQETTYEIPDLESGDIHNYGNNNKLPCGKCEKIAGMNFIEDLGFD